MDTPRSGKLYVSKKVEGDYINLVKYIIANNKNNEPIFSGSTRHDKIYINDTLLYFPTGTKAATKYWQFEPMYTRKNFQEEIIKDLESSKPKFIILWAIASVYTEPNESGKSSGVFLLDNYIRANYQVIKKFGYYFVLERKVQ